MSNLILVVKPGFGFLGKGEEAEMRANYNFEKACKIFPDFGSVYTRATQLADRSQNPDLLSVKTGPQAPG